MTRLTKRKSMSRF